MQLFLGANLALLKRATQRACQDSTRPFLLLICQPSRTFIPLPGTGDLLCRRRGKGPRRPAGEHAGSLLLG